jgi:hypothetical protein
MKFTFFLVVFCFSAFAQEIKLPSGTMQAQIIKELRDEMIRLDGEGLVARKGRSESFVQTTNKLAAQALDNQSVHDFFHSFSQVDATYTNLHSRTGFPESIVNVIDLPWYKDQSVWLFADTTQTQTRYFADYIPDPAAAAKISEGAELIAINGRAISEWTDEHFLYCKLPLKEQCDRWFEGGLLSLKLAWKGSTDLVYTFLHEGKSVDVKIEFKRDWNTTEKQRADRYRCDYKANKRYPGYKLVHLGYFACLFEKENDPSVGLLRISSFQYNRRRRPLNPYKNIWEEVVDLEKAWIPKSGQYKNLIIDVLDNTGGNLPIGYYQLLVQGKFQEQYVMFKKTPELENTKLRSFIFWRDPAQEMSYQRWISTGIWSQMSYGEFSKPIPMFCADHSKPCEDSLWRAKEHDFQGQVHVMLNDRCISSCDGFAASMKDNLDAKFYGFPQAADSAYSRLRLDVLWDENSEKGFRIVVAPQRADTPDNLIVSQVVAVSLACDAKGNIFAGNPIPLNEKVEYQFGKYYPRAVLQAVEKHL